jgi:hypothetical protein
MKNTGNNLKNKFKKQFKAFKMIYKAVSFGWKINNSD